MFQILFIIFSLIFSGCFQAHSEDDLRGIPVTNNPNLLPRSSQTAQGPTF